MGHYWLRIDNSYIVTSTRCLGHLTANQERDERLAALITPGSGVLRLPEFERCQWVEECLPAALGDLTRVHEYSWVACFFFFFFFFFFFSSCF
jgi:hypothetical protein